MNKHTLRQTRIQKLIRGIPTELRTNRIHDIINSKAPTSDMMKDIQIWAKRHANTPSTLTQFISTPATSIPSRPTPSTLLQFISNQSISTNHYQSISTKPNQSLTDPYQSLHDFISTDPQPQPFNNPLSSSKSFTTSNSTLAKFESDNSTLAKFESDNSTLAKFESDNSTLAKFESDKPKLVKFESDKPATFESDKPAKFEFDKHETPQIEPSNVFSFKDQNSFTETPVTDPFKLPQFTFNKNQFESQETKQTTLPYNNPFESLQDTDLYSIDETFTFGIEPKASVDTNDQVYVATPVTRNASFLTVPLATIKTETVLPTNTTDNYSKLSKMVWGNDPVYIYPVSRINDGEGMQAYNDAVIKNEQLNAGAILIMRWDAGRPMYLSEATLQPSTILYSTQNKHNVSHDMKLNFVNLTDARTVGRLFNDAKTPIDAKIALASNFKFDVFTRKT